MAERVTKNEIKRFFEKGDKPTEEQFAIMIDETYNEDEATESEVDDMVNRVLA